MQKMDAPPKSSTDAAEPPLGPANSIITRSHVRSSASTQNPDNALMLAGSTLGQFSFAPATQTTVVTTTTTTTTEFPPFLMRPPRNLRSLDPKLYPLATTETPTLLKNIYFSFGGKPTLFKEAEDASTAVDEVRGTHLFDCCKAAY